MDGGNVSDHEPVPVAVRQFSPGSANAVPFQYWPEETRRIETSTRSRPEVASEAVPDGSFHVAVRSAT